MVRPAALLFLGMLAASGAGWAFAVLPVNGSAAGLAAGLAGEDIGGRARASADPAPTAEEALHLEKLLAALRIPSPGPAPRGMDEGTPGTLVGRLPWEEVQGLLAWAAEQPRPVLEIEVKALAEDPGRAACRVVLGQ